MSDFLLGEVASLKNDPLSDLTVALALVPEAVAFPLLTSHQGFGFTRQIAHGRGDTERSDRR
jgi:hypothetical protein